MINRNFKTKFLLFSVFLVSISINSFAQEKTENNDWFHKDFKTTGIYGIGTKEALDFLKSKKLKPKTVIVGVIDSGIEVNHEDLAQNIYVNSKEAKGKNGNDDDKNGYIDDVNGWNFIGGKNGNIKYDTYEMTRVIKNYQSIFEGENAQRFKNDNPDKAKIYERAKKEFNEKKAESEQNLANILGQKEQTLKVYNFMKEFAGDVIISKENLEKLPTNSERDKAIKSSLLQMAESPEMKGKKIDDIISLIESEFKEAEDYYNEQLKYHLNLDYDERAIVGDDYSNKGEFIYGNNDYEGTDAEHGTHVAGIIAAQRNNDKGINGIAGDFAKILVVRAVPNGDERDKDVANAINYAVNNGAKIINMSFGKAYSLETPIVNLALKNAEDNDVLLVHAAGNDNLDIDISENYPTNFKKDETTSFLNNWLTIGSSTKNPNQVKSDFSNFGSLKVDLFAPGSDIYSLIPDNKYKSNSGTSMAAPVVSGCAAVLKAYFPKLTAPQIKEILMKSVSKINQSSVIGIGEDGTEKKRAFEALSVAGGIVNLFEAVKLAYEKYR